MTDRLVYVYADLGGTTYLVGRLYAHNNKGKETASREYEAAWLDNPLRYSLELALTVGAGQSTRQEACSDHWATPHPTAGAECS